METIRPSATVILYRGSGSSVEVYLVERSRKTRFFPGYHAFPGGVVDKADGEGMDARRRAAVRELAEETGVALPEAALVEAGRLITPPFGPTRYDTSFFFAECPQAAQPVVDGQELVSGRWWKPAEAIAAFHERALPIPPPTLAYLSLLRDHGDPAKVAALARATDGRPHHERFKVEIHPRVYVLPLRAPTLPPATTQNCYLLDGDAIYVVDPGTPFEEERVALFHTIDSMLAQRKRDVAIIITHHHGDHVGSLHAVKDRYHARALASASTAEAVDGIDGVLAPGERIRVAPGWEIEALHTPGHTAGHVALRDLRWGAIFAGDLVSGVSTILVDPDEGDMAQYMASLQRLSDLKPTLVLPGHGPAIPFDVFGQTLAHRREREQKIIKALSAKPQTPEEIVPVAYDDTPKEAWMLAERNLLSALLKLEKEGRARRVGDGWISAS